MTDDGWSDDAWERYYLEVWNARLDAHMYALYYGKLRRGYSFVQHIVTFFVTLASCGTVGVLLTTSWKEHAVWVGVATAVVAVFQQVADLPERIRKLENLSTGWARRTRFWDNAWIEIGLGYYIGDLETLTLADAELDGDSFFVFSKLLARCQDAVAATDPQK